MTENELQFFARIKSENGDSSSGMVVSNVIVSYGGETKMLLNDPVEISTGKTKNSQGKSGEAFVSVSVSNPNESYVETSGTGRVENLSGSFPTLKLGTKKNRYASGKGLYAELRVKSEMEGEPQVQIEYFDLVVGKKSENTRSGAPHFGFRPNSSSHFYVKTNELGAEHRSSGILIFGGSQVIPSKISIFCKNANAEIKIKFKYEESSNTIVADSISIN
jgi:hypothetical protein